MISLSDLTKISQPYKAILLDAYGVFWGGNASGILPDAKETMEKFVSEGKWVGIFSNSTQLVYKELNKYQTHGLHLGQHFHFLLTSGELAKNIFKQRLLPFETPQNRFWLYGSVHPKYSSHEVLFQESLYTATDNIKEADFIYISIPHIKGEDQTDPYLFQDTIQKIVSSGLPMVCANPDRFSHEGQPPRAVVRQGSVAAIYENLGGKVYYIGKPSAIAYQEALQKFLYLGKCHPQEILMIGDNPETDIRGAKQFGMSSALITQTGIMADRISHHGLTSAIQQLSEKDYPHYFIERLVS